MLFMSNKAKDEKKKSVESIRIYGLPKGSILWPTAVTAIVIGALGFIPHVDLTSVFFIVFGFNLMVLFFDFSRGVVVGIFGIIVAALALMYAFKVEFPAHKVVDNGIISGASPEFMLTFGILFLVIWLLAVWMHKSFDYYEVSSNEIVKKTGMLGDAQRFGAPNVQIKKEITDVFESLLLFGAGNLVIQTQTGQEFHILNVPRINKVELDMRKILGRLDVEVA